MIGRLALGGLLFAGAVDCGADAQMPLESDLPLYPAFATASAPFTCAVAGLGTVSVQPGGCLYTPPSGLVGTARVIGCASDATHTVCDTALANYSGGATVARSLAAGFWNYPPDGYCNTMGMTGIAQAISTPTVLGFLQNARRCNVRLVVIPLRKYLTTTGTTKSPFSLDSAKAFTDRLAKVLVPDTLRKYDATIIGMNLADDYGCSSCWGGQTVSPSQIEAWARYVRSKIPGLRIGVRAEPTFVQKSTTLASVIDYAWAQYHTGKGDAKTYFDKHTSLAKSLGIALAMGLNVKYCGGTGTVPCTPSQVKTYLGLAAGYPNNCALLGWTWTSTTFDVAGMLDAWKYVLNLAKQHPDVACRHA